jgi:hypothetical protein
METEKSRRKLYIVTIICIVFIMSLGTGYAMFQESLTISGVASTVDYYAGTRLPHTPIILDTLRNKYFTSNYDDGYSYSGNTQLKTFGYQNAITSEVWGDDTYTLVLDKSMIGAFQNKNITYTISFSNPTSIEYTSGTATITYGNAISNGVVSVAPNTSTDISSATCTLSETSLDYQDTTTITISTTLGTIDFTQDSIFKCQVSYKLYDMQTGGFRYFNFVVRYDSTVPNNSILDESLFTGPASIQQVNNGRYFKAYPVNLNPSNNYDAVVVDLKTKLEAGATYRFIRDYQGEKINSAGVVALRNANGAIVSSPAYPGLRYKDFTLTQEQIDSIDRIWIYGNNDMANNPLFTFIRIIKISD